MSKYWDNLQRTIGNMTRGQAKKLGDEIRKARNEEKFLKEVEIKMKYLDAQKEVEELIN